MQEKPKIVELSGTITIPPIQLYGDLTVTYPPPEPSIDTWEAIRRFINLDRIAEYGERLVEAVLEAFKIDGNYREDSPEKRKALR